MGCLFYIFIGCVIGFVSCLVLFQEELGKIFKGGGGYESKMS